MHDGSLIHCRELMIDEELTRIEEPNGTIIHCSFIEGITSTRTQCIHNFSSIPLQGKQKTKEREQATIVSLKLSTIKTREVL